MNSKALVNRNQGTQPVSFFVYINTTALKLPASAKPVGNSCDIKESRRAMLEQDAKQQAKVYTGDKSKSVVRMDIIKR